MVFSNGISRGSPWSFFILAAGVAFNTSGVKSSRCKFRNCRNCHSRLDLWPISGDLVFLAESDTSFLVHSQDICSGVQIVALAANMLLTCAFRFGAYVVHFEHRRLEQNQQQEAAGIYYEHYKLFFTNLCRTWGAFVLGGRWETTLNKFEKDRGREREPTDLPGLIRSLIKLFSYSRSLSWSHDTLGSRLYAMPTPSHLTNRFQNSTLKRNIR
jgi:hypothetical protein